MHREPVPGECVVVTRNIGEHQMSVGERLVVSHVDDNDGTLRGIPRGSATVADTWIPWSDVEPVSFGWDYARQHLPSEVVTLLAACDGVEHLALNSQIKQAILESLPDWRDRVMEAIESIDTELP